MTNVNKGGFRRGAGRPKKANTEPLSAEERTLLFKPHVKAIIDKLAEKAKDGDHKSAELFLAYAYGKPTERQEIADAREKGKSTLSKEELFDKIASMANEATDRALKDPANANAKQDTIRVMLDAVDIQD